MSAVPAADSVGSGAIACAATPGEQRRGDLAPEPTAPQRCALLEDTEPEARRRDAACDAREHLAAGCSGGPRDRPRPPRRRARRAGRQDRATRRGRPRGQQRSGRRHGRPGRPRHGPAGARTAPRARRARPPRAARSNSRKNGDASAIGCTAEQVSCSSPVSDPGSACVRAPPPASVSASRTRTPRPARASVTAAARPFGPDPTTTTSYASTVLPGEDHGQRSAQLGDEGDLAGRDAQEVRDGLRLVGEVFALVPDDRGVERCRPCSCRPRRRSSRPRTACRLHRRRRPSGRRVEHPDGDGRVGHGRLGLGGDSGSAAGSSAAGSSARAGSSAAGSSAAGSSAAGSSAAGSSAGAPRSGSRCSGRAATRGCGTARRPPRRRAPRTARRRRGRGRSCSRPTAGSCGRRRGGQLVDPVELVFGVLAHRARLTGLQP